MSKCAGHIPSDKHIGGGPFQLTTFRYSKHVIAENPNITYPCPQLNVTVKFIVTVAFCVDMNPLSGPGKCGHCFSFSLVAMEAIITS